MKTILNSIKVLTALLLFVACKNTYKCDCTYVSNSSFKNAGTYSIIETKKHKAQKKCSENNYTDPSGSTILNKECVIVGDGKSVATGKTNKR